MENWQATLLAQYANSPIILQLIESMNDAIDPSANIDAFYQKIWDISTAEGYGLDVWGSIVGVSRIVYLPGSSTGDFMGFKESTNPEAEFGQNKFFTPAANSSYALDDTNFRILILTKALSNIGGAGIPAYNTLLMTLYPGRGNVYVVDNLNMTMTIKFMFPITSVEKTILMQTGVFTPPTGVSYTISTP